MEKNIIEGFDTVYSEKEINLIEEIYQQMINEYDLKNYILIKGCAKVDSRKVTLYLMDLENDQAAIYIRQYMKGINAEKLVYFDLDKLDLVIKFPWSLINNSSKNGYSYSIASFNKKIIYDILKLRLNKLALTSLLLESHSNDKKIGNIYFVDGNSSNCTSKNIVINYINDQIPDKNKINKDLVKEFKLIEPDINKIIQSLPNLYSSYHLFHTYNSQLYIIKYYHISDEIDMVEFIHKYKNDTERIILDRGFLNEYITLYLSKYIHRQKMMIDIYLNNKIPLYHAIYKEKYHCIHDGKVIDHINRNRRDNRLCNLREVDYNINSRNACTRKINTSGITGVTFNKVKNRWVANRTINKNGQLIKARFLNFHKFEDAVIARKKLELITDIDFLSEKKTIELLNEYELNGKFNSIHQVINNITPH